MKILVCFFCWFALLPVSKAQPFTLTISKSGTGGGTVNSAPAGINCGSACSAVFSSGTEVTITATPDATSSFGGWSGGGTSGTGTQNVVMNSDKNISALFTRNSYALNVSVTGTGSGTVTSAPAGISCPGDCAENYVAETSVNLTATPGTGSVFTGWSGACTGTGSCNVSITSVKNVTATFTYISNSYYPDNDGDGYGAGDVIIAAVQPENTSINNLDCDDTNPAVHPGAIEICGNATDDNCNGVADDCSMFALTISKSGTGGGTVNSAPAGINCGSVCTAYFASGTEVTITATPDATSSFGGWSGGGTSGTGTQNVVMNSDKNISALFTRNSYALNVSVTGTGSGTVTSAPAGISCPGDCAENYVAETSVALTATPGSGSVFTGWSGACTGTGACFLSMTSGKSVSAGFCLLPAIPGTISGNHQACVGTSQTYSIEAVPNASSYSWTLPPGWVGSSTTNSITATSGSSGTISVIAINSCGSGPSQNLNVSVNPVYAFTENHSICAGEIYTWQGSDCSEAGTYQARYNTIHGCDSIYTLNLTVNPAYAFMENNTICAGETYIWQGTGYSDAGSYQARYNTIRGCDSIYTLNLTVNPAYAFTENHSICAGEIYTWQGSDCTDAGTYQARYNTIHGCDSIYTLNLTVNPAYAFTENHSMCAGETYTWHGGNYFAAGTYTAGYETINGCDSIYSLHLTVNTVDISLTVNDRVITANASGAAYQWLDCDNAYAPVFGEIFQSFTVAGNGNYAVEVTQDACSDTSVSVQVNPVGIPTLQATGITVYPNPVTNELILNNKGNHEKMEFEILNSSGRIIFQGNLYETAIVNTSDFSPGLYILRLKNGLSFEIKKIIKE